jgi:hypothetical protein
MTAVARSHFPLEGECDYPSNQPVALDDPVPSESTVAVIAPQFCQDPPHLVESEVRRALTSRPELHFKSLVVRRLRNGVCLEGVLEADDSAPDVDELAREVAGVECVINRLLVNRLAAPSLRHG